jgi:7-cyano-7-deazaguanine synthase in queuosine biosynthesis
MKKNSQAQFLKYLKEHKLEDIGSILDIEKLLIKKRNYICKMPSPGTDVIHLVSGGIDSITVWAMLMEEYKLRVHPICVNTGQKRHSQELESINYFSKIFKKRYKGLYVEPFHLTFPTSAPEISSKLRGNLKKTIHPQVLKDNFDPETHTVTLVRKYLFPAYFPYPAALAALFFEMQKNLKIRTIFCSILPTDGQYNASQTLTAIRGAMISLCTFTNDYSWQVVSLCFEKEFDSILNKPDLIKWANDHQIQIEHTFTCLKSNEVHCGECIACLHRKESFHKANVIDKTKYSDQIKNNKKIKLETIKSIVRPIRPIYKPLLEFIRSRKLISSKKSKRKIFIKDYY